MTMQAMAIVSSPMTSPPGSPPTNPYARPPVNPYTNLTNPYAGCLADSAGQGSSTKSVPPLPRAAVAARVSLPRHRPAGGLPFYCPPFHV